MSSPPGERGAPRIISVDITHLVVAALKRDATDPPTAAGAPDDDTSDPGV